MGVFDVGGRKGRIVLTINLAKFLLLYTRIGIDRRYPDVAATCIELYAERLGGVPMVMLMRYLRKLLATIAALE